VLNDLEQTHYTTADLEPFEKELAGVVSNRRQIDTTLVKALPYKQGIPFMSALDQTVYALYRGMKREEFLPEVFRQNKLNEAEQTALESLVKSWQDHQNDPHIAPRELPVGSGPLLKWPGSSDAKMRLGILLVTFLGLAGAHAGEGGTNTVETVASAIFTERLASTSHMSPWAILILGAPILVLSATSAFKYFQWSRSHDRSQEQLNQEHRESNQSRERSDQEPFELGGAFNASFY